MGELFHFTRQKIGYKLLFQIETIGLLVVFLTIHHLSIIVVQFFRKHMEIN